MPDQHAVATGLYNLLRSLLQAAVQTDIEDNGKAQDHWPCRHHPQSPARVVIDC